jgi:hypothetical protein
MNYDNILFLQEDSNRSISINNNTLTYLGMNITRLKNGDIFINQPGYVDKILKETNMEYCKPTRTPEALNDIKQFNDDELCNKD